MATVHADYQERKQIVFTARGREHTNVREMVDDGPLGYTSTELLLIALGNCTLGALLNQEILKDAPVISARATLSAEMARNPSRVKRIDVSIDLAVSDPALLDRREDIEAIACTCPICNTLGSVEIVSTVAMRVGELAAV